MPRICWFYGIAVYMYYKDHPPPHIHAIYAEHEAVIGIESGEILQGELPRRARDLVREWALQSREELLLNWRRAREGEPVQPMKPLD